MAKPKHTEIVVQDGWGGWAVLLCSDINTDPVFGALLPGRGGTCTFASQQGALAVGRMWSERLRRHNGKPLPVRIDRCEDEKEKES